MAQQTKQKTLEWKWSRWLELYLNKLPNDTPHDPVEVVVEAVGRDANLFDHFRDLHAIFMRNDVVIVDRISPSSFRTTC